MPANIDNSADVIDSRDIIGRIEALEAEKQDLPLVQEDAAELQSLIDLRDQCEPYVDDWEYGVALIRDSYFEDYAYKVAYDIGAVKEDATWPNSCIDWEQAARELQMDYTSVEFDGVTYWVR